MRDHYTELLMAGIQNFGWGWANQIEIEAINDAVERGEFYVSDLPTALECNEWRATAISDDGCIEWNGDGGGLGNEAWIVSDMHGNYLREAE